MDKENKMAIRARRPRFGRDHAQRKPSRIADMLSSLRFLVHLGVDTECYSYTQRLPPILESKNSGIDFHRLSSFSLCF